VCRPVDRFLRGNLDARQKIREVHPEILFWALNAQSPMSHSKKKRTGYQERLDVLRRHFPKTDELVNEALSSHRRKQVAKDDILDALAAAVIGLCARSRLATIPINPEKDDFGLNMEMIYCKAE